jgi:hypothetical protein
MKNSMRTLTLSAAALAALVAAPKSNAQEVRRGEVRETFRGSPGHGGNFRGGDHRGREVRGGDFRGREFRGYGGYNRGFVRPQGYSYGRPYISPFRVFAGSRFYSYCPGPGYIYIDDFGWVFPPFRGALWIPRFDPFGIRIGGFWR